MSQREPTKQRNMRVPASIDQWLAKKTEKEKHLSVPACILAIVREKFIAETQKPRRAA
jgi:hypothetical protein